MATLDVTIKAGGTTWQANLDQGRCIAIPLHHERPQPNAYFAPLYDAEPVRVGDWTGDTRSGASVNFFNVRINPHGNGTHTECLGHITNERYSIHDILGPGRWLAEVVSVYPEKMDDGDRVIRSLDWHAEAEAIVLRTLPNGPEKMHRHYGDTNPPYLDAGLVGRMAERGIIHLLLDLPSLDRESDGGALAAHRAFWAMDKTPRTQATITEMVYVPDDLPDGLYLLEIQVPAWHLDAAPSRPFLYPLT